MSTAIQLAGHAFELLPERAVYWRARRSLLLADVHLGKDQVFRRSGMAVPAGVLGTELARISRLVARTGAERLIVLGDWVHAPPDPNEDWPSEISDWRRAHRNLAMDLVLGNHDRALRDWLEAWSIESHRSALDVDGLRLVHEWGDAAARPGMSGHLHPGAVVKSGHERLRLPAFLLAGQHLVLPAFGRFTGLMDQTPFPTEQCWVIAGQRVLPAPLPGRSIRA